MSRLEHIVDIYEKVDELTTIGFKENMSKPNNPKCATCFVINNTLRCWNCKHKTKEWERKNIKPIIMQGEKDLYKPKIESEE